MSIASNASAVSSNTKWIVIGFALIAVLAAGVAYMINRFVGHLVWYAIGVILVFVAIRLFSLRT